MSDLWEQYRAQHHVSLASVLFGNAVPNYIAWLEAKLTESRTLLREHGFGANSPDLEDAIRQCLQAYLSARDNAAMLQAKLTEARKDGTRLWPI